MSNIAAKKAGASLFSATAELLTQQAKQQATHAVKHKVMQAAGPLAPLVQGAWTTAAGVHAGQKMQEKMDARNRMRQSANALTRLTAPKDQAQPSAAGAQPAATTHPPGPVTQALAAVEPSKLSLAERGEQLLQQVQSSRPAYEGQEAFAAAYRAEMARTLGLPPPPPADPPAKPAAIEAPPGGQALLLPATATIGTMPRESVIPFLKERNADLKALRNDLAGYMLKNTFSADAFNEKWGHLLSSSAEGGLHIEESSHRKMWAFLLQDLNKVI